MQVCATMRTVRASARILRFCASACASRACKRFSASHRKLCALLRAPARTLRVPARLRVLSAQLGASSRLCARFCAPLHVRAPLGCLCTPARLCAPVRASARLCALSHASASSPAFARFNASYASARASARLRVPAPAACEPAPASARVRARLHVRARLRALLRVFARFCAPVRALRAVARLCAHEPEPARALARPCPRLSGLPRSSAPLRTSTCACAPAQTRVHALSAAARRHAESNSARKSGRAGANVRPESPLRAGARPDCKFTRARENKRRNRPFGPDRAQIANPGTLWQVYPRNCLFGLACVRIANQGRAGAILPPIPRSGRLPEMRRIARPDGLAQSPPRIAHSGRGAPRTQICALGANETRIVRLGQSAPRSGRAGAILPPKCAGLQNRTRWQTSAPNCPHRLGRAQIVDPRALGS